MSELKAGKKGRKAKQNVVRKSLPKGFYFASFSCLFFILNEYSLKFC